MMSITARSLGSAFSSASASSASPAVLAFRPSETTHRAMMSRTAGSSSTIRTEVKRCHGDAVTRLEGGKSAATCRPAESTVKKGGFRCRMCDTSHVRTLASCDSAHTMMSFRQAGMQLVDDNDRAQACRQPSAASRRGRRAAGAEGDRAPGGEGRLRRRHVRERRRGDAGADAQAGRSGDGRPADARRERPRSAAPDSVRGAELRSDSDDRRRGGRQRRRGDQAGRARIPHQAVRLRSAAAGARRHPRGARAPRAGGRAREPGGAAARVLRHARAQPRRCRKSSA